MSESVSNLTSHVHVPASTELAAMDVRDFTRHKAATNEAFEAARLAYEDACQALGDLLTEDIARHVRNTYGPVSWVLQVRAAAEFCTDSTGHRDSSCEGHNERLVAAAVMGTDGTILAFPDPMSPLNYWLERLTPLMGTEDAILNLDDREWSFGRCDCGDEGDLAA